MTGACATPPSPNVPPPAEGTANAYFTGYPSHLFQAAKAICSDPGDTFIQTGANQVRCESTPAPQAAAALILQYNGTVDELPKFVIAFNGEQQTAGYLVTADSYILVPLRTGGATLLRLPNPEIREGFETLLEQAGGRPQ